MHRRNPLIFRKDGSLDFGPLLLAVAASVGVFLLLADAFGMARVSVAAWAFLGSFVSLAFIAGAAAERAFWISQSKTPGEVATGIATASSEPDLWRDNETGDDDPVRDYRGRRRG
jgi:hypothetical protein